MFRGGSQMPVAVRWSSGSPIVHLHRHFPFSASSHRVSPALIAMPGRYVERPKGQNLPRQSWWGAVYGNGDIYCGNSGFPDDSSSEEWEMLDLAQGSPEIVALEDHPEPDDSSVHSSAPFDA